MQHEKDEPIEEPTTYNSEDVDADEFDDEETSRELVVPGEILTEDTKINMTLVCIGNGSVQTMNSDARSAEIRKGDIIQVYRENQHFYFGSPTLQSGMRFKHVAGLSGKDIKNEFPNTTGLEIAISKKHVGQNEDDFWATFKKK